MGSRRSALLVLAVALLASLIVAVSVGVGLGEPGPSFWFGLATYALLWGGALSIHRVRTGQSTTWALVTYLPSVLVGAVFIYLGIALWIGWLGR